jgi:hypothetical protein
VAVHDPNCRIGPGALLRPGPPKNRTCTFQRIRLKQAGQGPLARRRTIRSRSWSVSSAGPFTATLVAASNLPVGSGVVVTFASLAHLTASARFRAGPPGVRIRPVMRDDRLEGAAITSRFPVAFRLPAFASRSSDARRGAGPSSRSAYRPEGRTPTGLPRSARTSCDRGGCPLYPGDRRCSSRPRDVLSRRLPLYRGQSLVPAPASHRQGFASRGINEGSHDSPVRSSLACGRPGGTGSPWASPRASHPAVAGDARRGWDRPSSTDLELHAHIRSILQSGSSLMSCDLASHRPTRKPSERRWGYRMRARMQKSGVGRIERQSQRSTVVPGPHGGPRALCRPCFPRLGTRPPTR